MTNIITHDNTLVFCCYHYVNTDYGVLNYLSKFLVSVSKQNTTLHTHLHLLYLYQLKLTLDIYLHTKLGTSKYTTMNTTVLCRLQRFARNHTLVVHEGLVRPEIKLHLNLKYLTCICVS